jgi:hypothetical protein
MKYTESELTFIQGNLNMTDAEIAKGIGRTEKAIRTQRRRMSCLKVKHLNPAKWTQAEIDNYIELWGKHTGDQLAKIYEVTRRAICHVNNRLGLKKGTDWKSYIHRVTYKHTLNPRARRKDAREIGSIAIRKNGTFIKKEKGWQGLHIYNWIKAGNPKPRGSWLIFKDGNIHNCDVSNLELRLRKTPKVPKEPKERKPRSTKKQINEIQRLLKQQQKEAQKALRLAKKEERLREQERKRKAREEKENRIKIENEWHKARRAKEPKRIPTRVIDYSQLRAVRVDHKTIIYVRPDANVEKIIKQYSKAS